jgi:hypothetical protein
VGSGDLARKARKAAVALAKLSIVASFAAVGCGGATEPHGGGAAALGSGDSTPGPTVDSVTVSIQGIAEASDGSPVPGASVCLRPDPLTSNGATCTTSDASGAWKLTGAPSRALVGVTFIKTGFLPMLRPIATGGSDVTIPAGDAALLASTDPAAALMSNPSGIDPTAGHVAFFTAVPGAQPAAPATVTLDPLGSTTATTEPAALYLNTAGQVVPQATSGSRGFFLNLTPGLYVATFSGTSSTCSSAGSLYGQPVTLYTPGGQARTMLPVVAGFVTAPVAASCTATSSGS